MKIVNVNYERPLNKERKVWHGVPQTHQDDSDICRYAKVLSIPYLPYMLQMSKNCLLIFAAAIDYSGEILTIELFMVPYSTFWSHFTSYAL